MRYWPGIVFLALGVWLFLLGRKTRRDADAARERGELEPLNPSLVALAEIVPSLVTFGLFVIGGMTAIGFFAFDAGRYLSLLDLGGFLAALAGYGYWFIETSHKRLPR